ncbi:hypothetical protein Rhopal_006887-T1 [Rhodotorula paludigena]|uniref:HMG domain-containing protein n=1 Tax=Rhodotorula paludigena TaxID=86838 RepID=A0AAV5GXD8_9BASI|nr:hypothetical protein Rhopal_006887-T1 [Rhodotorula paludigena]
MSAQKRPATASPELEGSHHAHRSQRFQRGGHPELLKNLARGGGDTSQAARRTRPAPPNLDFSSTPLAHHAVTQTPSTPSSNHAIDNYADFYEPPQEFEPPSSSDDEAEPAADQHEELAYQYLALVYNHSRHLFRLGESSWVLPGWQEKRRHLSDNYVHLTYNPIADFDLCSCPSAEAECVHRLAHRLEHAAFIGSEPCYPPTTPLPAVVLLWDGGTPRLGLSVQQSAGWADSGKHVCSHIKQAQAHARELEVWSEEEDLEAREEAATGMPSTGVDPPSISYCARDWTSFTIHTSTGSITRSLQTFCCPRCTSKNPKLTRRIGPDLVQYGIFNYNNEIGFMRKVFDTFLLKLSKGPLTLEAYVAGLADDHVTLGMMHTTAVLSARMFSRAFFGFLRTLAIDVPMACKACGPKPDLVVCDGTAMGFASNMLRSSLRPPTMPSPRSTVNADLSTDDIVFTLFPLSALPHLRQLVVTGSPSSELLTAVPLLKDLNQDGYPPVLLDL